MSKLKAARCQHGGVNDAPWPTGKCPLARVWAHMHERCNPANWSRFPAYIGCSVHPEWLHFTTFHAWATMQDWQGKTLDKDLKVPGNRVYSADTCLWVPQALNKLMVRPAVSELPLGVHWDKARRAYVAQLRKYGRQTHLGRFRTAEAAAEAYTKAKAAHIRRLAEEYPQFTEWLEQHASLLESK